MGFSFWRIVLLAHLVAGHDEGAADVAVLHQTFAVFQLEQAGDLDGRRPRGIGDRHDHVDGQAALLDGAGQLAPEVDPRLVDVDLVQVGVGAGEVDVFEDAGLERGGLQLFLVDGAVLVDEDGRAGGDVADIGITQQVEGDALGGEGEAREHPSAVAAEKQRPDAVGIAEADHALVGDVDHHGIGALDPLVDLADGAEHALRA